jgi:hypothetical protein
VKNKAPKSSQKRAIESSKDLKGSALKQNEGSSTMDTTEYIFNGKFHLFFGSTTNSSATEKGLCIHFNDNQDVFQELFPS